MQTYIPTMEELEKLQALGIDVYKYILVKVVEIIILEDLIYDERDMLEILDNIDEHPEIIYAVCKLFNKKINSSIITSKDPELCCELLKSISKEDKIIYKLDDILMNFDESVLLNKGVIKNTIEFLSKHLSSCPKYRFDYLGPNILLDSIFSCGLPNSKISPESYDNLILIDPIYSVKLDFQEESKKDKIEKLHFPVQRGMAVYTGRYGLDNYTDRRYQNKDIINKPDENVKKLIKCLEYHKQNY